MNFQLTKLEIKKGAFREYRKRVFQAFDLWEKAVLRGREVEDSNVMTWYQSMLSFTEYITENTLAKDYPTLPIIIRKYL